MCNWVDWCASKAFLALSMARRVTLLLWSLLPGILPILRFCEPSPAVKVEIMGGTSLGSALFQGNLDCSSLIFIEGVFRNFSRFTFDAEKCV